MGTGRGRECSRAARLSLRAASAGAVQLEADGAARHHTGLGQETRGNRVHGRDRSISGEYYTRVAEQRGAQAARNSDRKIVYGEAYENVFPHVTDALA